MKTVLLLLVAAALVGGLWLLDATDMTADKTYDTLADAQADGGGVAHGWLPNRLPSSSHKIRTLNDLDLNSSQGHFYFDPKDAPELTAKLRTGSPSSSKFANWQELLAEARKSNKTLFWYQEHDQTWSFFCDLSKGRCEYLMW